METAETIRVLDALIDGVNPDTREKLDENSVCNTPLVMRALMSARDSVKRCERFDERRGSLPKKSGHAWTKEEEQQLVSGFKDGKEVQFLGSLLGRSTLAIQARLIRLGMLEDDGTLRIQRSSVG